MADETLKHLIDELGIDFAGDAPPLAPATLDSIRSKLKLAEGELSDEALERLLRASAIMASDQPQTAEALDALEREMSSAAAPDDADLYLLSVDNSDLDALLKAGGRTGGGTE